MNIRLYINYLDIFKNHVITFLLSQILIIVLFSTYAPSLLPKILPFLLIINIIFLFSLFFLANIKIKNELDKYLPFYILYLYAIATTTTNITRFFEEAAKEETLFKYHTYYMKKVLNLRKRFNYTFPEAIRYLLHIIPNTSFKSFLESFSTALEVGENLEDFLDREFNNYMSKYETNYKKSLENFRLVQDLFISVITSLAFSFEIIMIVPLLMNISFEILLMYFGIIYVSVLFLIYSATKYLILDDPLWIKGKDKPKKYKKYLYLLFPFFIINFLIFHFTFVVLRLPFLLSISISVIPNVYISKQIKTIENELKKKEIRSPSFFNKIISLSEVYGNNQTKILGVLKNHDFGELNDDIIRLYRRTYITKDNENAWMFFVKDIGSELLNKTVFIYISLLKLSANLEKAGNKIYEILLKMLDLRTLRDSFAVNTRGILYGTFIGLTLVLYLSLGILIFINQVFSGFSNLLKGTYMAEIGLSFFSINIPMEFIRLIIDIFVLLSAITISASIKNIEGTSKLGMFYDLVIMLWIASAIDIGVSYFMSKIFIV